MDQSSIDKFSNITHASEEEAKHYLEAFNGDCDEAVKAYFESEESHLLPDISELNNVNNVSSTSLNTRESRNLDKGVSTNGKPKIATLRPASDDGLNDDEDRQAFYVGGSETGGGGQQVLGPSGRHNYNRNESPEAFVQGVFQDAKSKGAEVMNVTSCCSLNPDRKKTVPFSGVGHRLGVDQSTSEQDIVPQPSLSSDEADKNVIVKMWRDGFSLDDGPLRSYAESTEFFDDIRSGRVPQELFRYAGGGSVHVMLEDHHNENWCAPPTSKVKPFSGKGQMLGFPTPSIVQKDTSTSEAVPMGPAVEVDESQPITQIQVRVPDGGRLLIRLNHSHTVGDIRRQVVNERPDLASKTFNLMVAYPSRNLTNDQETLLEANLLNTVLRLV